MDDSQRFKRERYKFWLSEHVRFSDLDMLGHVNNNSVGQYFEDAFTSFYIKLVPTWPREKRIFIMASYTIDFRKELHRGDQLEVGCCVASIGNTSMKIASAIFCKGHGVAYCENTSVLIDRETRTPIQIPDDVRALLKPYLDDRI